MTDEEKKDPPETIDINSKIEELQKDIDESGTKGDNETFSLLPGKDAVIMMIKHLPNDPDGEKVLAIQLPPEMAVQLGQALVNCALIVALSPHEGEVEEKKESVSDLPSLEGKEKKVWIN